VGREESAKCSVKNAELEAAVGALSVVSDPLVGAWDGVEIGSGWMVTVEPEGGRSAGNAEGRVQNAE